MTVTDKLFEIVKRKGPIIPSDVAKDINQNLLFTSAMLSELKSRNMVLISKLKIGGGSPLYYTPEQAKDLVRFIKFLDQKDQRAVMALQQHKVLRDTQVTPLVRVSLREVKDFAVALEVSFGDTTEIFWKWYMTSDQEASQIINEMINGGTKKPQQEPIKEEIKPDPIEEKQIKEEPVAEKQTRGSSTKATRGCS